MHKTVIFLETSLSHNEAKTIYPDATYLPSIKKGDIIKSIRRGYSRIIIIDGNFNWTPSVWHKEILLAIEMGIEVTGAVSMGALRAAELNAIGMKGIGRIYDMYKNEVIDGDDEVAIVYNHYTQKQTIPFINIRATLDKISNQNLLVTENIIHNRLTIEELLNKIRKIHFSERDWGKLAQSLPNQLYKIIKLNYIDLKKIDTIDTLTYLKSNPSSNVSSLNKEHKRGFTIFEKKLLEDINGPFNLTHLNYSQKESQRALFIKKRKNYPGIQRAKNLIKLLSLSKTKRNLQYFMSLINHIDTLPFKITESEMLAELHIFREERNLLTGDDFKSWLKTNYLLLSKLDTIVFDYAKIKKYWFAYGFTY